MAQDMDLQKRYKLISARKIYLLQQKGPDERKLFVRKYEKYFDHLWYERWIPRIPLLSRHAHCINTYYRDEKRFWDFYISGWLIDN